MPDRVQDLTNHRKVAVACKNYTDEQIAKSEERMKWYIGEIQTTTQDDNTTAYQKTVPANATRCKIKRIYGNSVKYAPTTASDGTTAYQKNVPSYSPSIDRASANINTLGCMSYKVNQLVDSGTDTTREVSGVTTILHNGKYTASGTATANDYNVTSKTITLKANHKYLILTNVTGTSQSNTSWQIYCSDLNLYTIDNRIYNNASDITTTIRVVYYNGAVLSMSYNIMLFDLTADFGSGNEPTSVSDCATEYAKRGVDIYSYTPQQSGIRDTAPTSIKSVGANILNPDNTFTYLPYDDLVYFECVGGATYTLKSFGSYTGGFSIFKYDGNSWSLIESHTLNSGYTITAPSDAIRIGVNGVVDQSVMAVNGSTTPTTYKPYFTASLLIPAQVQALDGYGWGVNSTCYNYIDFNAKKFVKKANKYTFTGEESCDKYPGTTPMYRISFVGAKDDHMNALLTSTKWNMQVVATASASGTWGVEIQGGYIYFQPPSDVITTEAQLLADITGLTIEYEMTTPVETDISAYLTTNEIEIEPNGTLSFESTYNAYVPSDVSYNGVIKHALATAVKLEGANLSPISSGLTNFLIDALLPKGTYTLSCHYKRNLGENSGFNIRKNTIDGSGIETIYTTEEQDVTTTFTLDEECKIFINCFSNSNITNIMLNYGSTALSYRPHKATVTRALPYQASDGWGIGSVRNVRDFTINKRGTNVNNQDLEDLNRTYDSTYNVWESIVSGFKEPATNNDKANLLAENYNTDTTNNIITNITTNTIGLNNVPSPNTSLYVYNGSSTTTPTGYLYYELDDEHKTESDITAIDNILVVEEGDTLTFVNEEGLPVPSDLTYRIEVARV